MSLDRDAVLSAIIACAPANMEISSDPSLRVDPLAAAYVEGVQAAHEAVLALAVPTLEQWAALVANERARQVTLGWDIEHDREHGVAHLLGLAIEYGRRGHAVQAAALAQAAWGLIMDQHRPTLSPTPAEPHVAEVAQP